MSAVTTVLHTRLDRALQSLPRDYSGPGGAVAVLREGEVLVRHAWGWANAERRIPFTPTTLFRICSITKQFTCGLLLEAFPDPSVLDGDVRARLPRWTAGAGRPAPLPQPVRPARLLGGGDAAWRPAEALRRRRGRPGDRRRPHPAVRAGDALFLRQPELPHPVRYPAARPAAASPNCCATRVFDRPAWPTPSSPPTPAPCRTGRKAMRAPGRRVSPRREPHPVDRRRRHRRQPRRHDRLGAPYRCHPRRSGRALSPPRRARRFADGAPAGYGFGLGRGRRTRPPVTGHGGGLRGWRSHRLHAPGGADLGRGPVQPPVRRPRGGRGPVRRRTGRGPAAAAADAPPPAWLGPIWSRRPAFPCASRPRPTARCGCVSATPRELLDLTPTARRATTSAAAAARRRRSVDGSPGENLSSRLRPCAGGLPRHRRPLPLRGAGRRTDRRRRRRRLLRRLFRLSRPGRMELLEPIGPDVWALPCPRALDHTPPGDWTLAFRRDDNGRVAAVDVGCWLARGLA